MKLLNLLIKLKLLKLLYINKLILFNKNINLELYWLNILPNFLKYTNFSLNNTMNTLSLSKLNFLFTNNIVYNQLYLYSYLINTSNYNIKTTNFNVKYLFLYYYKNYFNQNKNSKILKNFFINNLFFLKYFISKFIYNYFKNKKLLINIQKNYININDNSNAFNLILSKVKRLVFLKEININVKSFLNFIVVSLYSKDVILFKNFVKYILENLHFKKHRRFLYNLKILLNTIILFFNYKINILGLFIKVKGKIGVGGNLKKRKYIFKKGSFSFTKKNQKLVYCRDSIRTYSGVLGFEIYLSYR